MLIFIYVFSDFEGNKFKNNRKKEQKKLKNKTKSLLTVTNDYTKKRVLLVAISKKNNCFPKNYYF